MSVMGRARHAAGQRRAPRLEELLRQRLEGGPNVFVEREIDDIGGHWHFSPGVGYTWAGAKEILEAYRTEARRGEHPTSRACDGLVQRVERLERANESRHVQRPYPPDARCVYCAQAHPGTECAR
jgi:hypothetical protein